MSDETVKISAFSSLAKSMQEKQINVTDEELDSLFNDTLTLNNTENIDVSIFAKAISDKYSIEADDIVLDEINKLASGDGINSDLSYEDINIQYVENLLENDSKTQEAIVSVLENIVNSQQESLNATKENNGIIAKGWDWIKNKTGIGAGSNKVQSEIDTLKEQITTLKNDSSCDNLKEVYKAVTGHELDAEEFTKLCSGEVDYSSSKVINSLNKYQQGQKQVVNTISTIGSALTVVGLVTAGVVAAPFTGGISLGASFAALGTLTAAGTAAYMVPQAIDGLTEKDGYSAKEVAEDLASGVINSAITATGIGVGKSLATGLSAKAATQAGKTAAGLAASEATSVIMGDGIAVGEYLKEVALNDEVDFSWSELGKTAASATAASLAAGATAFGTSSALRPILTSGATAQSQVVGRLITSGVSGATAGASATAAAGSTNYLMSCAIDGKEISFDEWLEASTENIASGTLTGVLSGVAFEAVQISSGTQKPQNAVKTQKGTTEDGINYTDYLDKDGNVIARDIKAKDLMASSKEVSANTRTVRITFDSKAAQASQYDWADNVTSSSRVVTAEIESEINNLAKELSSEYVGNIKSVENSAMEEFGDLSTTEKITARDKSADSIAAKLKSKYLSGKLDINVNDSALNIESARVAIADAYGTRLQMKSLTQTEAASVIQEVCGKDVTLEDFSKAMNEYVNGNTNIDSKYIDALNALKETQNAQTFNKLLSDVKNGKINITEINNYGNDISSYFTERQVLELADAYYQANNGEKALKIVTKDNLLDSKVYTLEQIEQLAQNYDSNFLSGFDADKISSVTKKSGYASCQMNVEYDLDSTTGYGEFQIRGTSVNAFADAEHIPYDIRQGKITESNTKYSDVYSTFKNMSEDSYSVYNKYLSATYDYLRLQELGINITKPELTTNLTYQNGASIPQGQIQMITQEGLIQVKANAH